MRVTTDFFHHQLGPSHPLGTPNIPVTGKVFSRPVTIAPGGNLLAMSHTFHDLVSYDFWLQIRVDAGWIDLLETVPYERFKPREYKGKHVPRGAMASKIYRLSGLPAGVEVRAASSHLETYKNRLPGGWGVTLATDLVE